MITLHMEPIVTPEFIDTAICIDESVRLRADADQISTYQWFSDGQVVSNSSVFDTESAGNFTVISQTLYCTSEPATVNVVVLNPTIELSDNELDTYEGEVATASIINPDPNYTYEWYNQNTGDTDSGTQWSSTINEDNIIEVTANQRHCSVSDEIDIRVLASVSIPTAFSPNADGINDEWVLEGLETYDNPSVEVYNRWGTLVYQRYGSDSNWDGNNVNGLPLAIGTYFYVIKLNDGRQKSFSGDVTIMK